MSRSRWTPGGGCGGNSHVPTGSPPDRHDEDALSDTAREILDFARRRRVARIRLRSRPGGGVATFGSVAVATLSADACARCLSELRAAARLPPDEPHVLGSFSCLGERVRVEIYACHDGEKGHLAIGDVTPSPETRRPSAAIFGAAIESHAVSLAHLGGGRLPLETLMALRLAAEAGTFSDLLERLGDTCLFGAAARESWAPDGLRRLADVLGRALAEGHVEAVVPVLLECGRLGWSDRALSDDLAVVAARTLGSGPASLRSHLRQVLLAATRPPMAKVSAG